MKKSATRYDRSLNTSGALRTTVVNIHNMLRYKSAGNVVQRLAYYISVWRGISLAMRTLVLA